MEPSEEVWAQSELHLGARSVLFMEGCFICMAACSVRSSWESVEDFYVVSGDGVFSCQGIMSGGGFDPVYGFIKRIESVALFVFCHAVD